MYDGEVQTARAPLYGISGLLGVTMMVLLFVSFPEIRWFALFSIPLGIVMALGMRYSRYLTGRRGRRIIWSRDGAHFRWPQPIG